MNKAVYYIHSGNLGQWQESGRDQGHNTLGIALMGPICEMAWNQGDDLYGYWNNRFLAGAEYVAKFNLGYDVPYQAYMWGTGQKGQWSIQTGISHAGRGSIRPIWELVYGHYTGRLGMAAPYTAQSVVQVRPEGGGSRSHSSTFDQLGFGILTFARDRIVIATKPISLMATKSADKVVLSWWGVVVAISYNVKRSSKVDGPFINIAVSDKFHYTDADLAPGKYYYMVTGLMGSTINETAPSNIVEISTIPELYMQLRFDQTDGITVEDATGNGHNGTLVNNASFVAGKSNNAVLLDGRNSYMSLPEGLMSNLTDFTISAWVYLNDNTHQWSRIFDFGGKPGAHMFLTPKGPKGTVRYLNGKVDDFRIYNGPLSAEKVAALTKE
jgi:hypothetical protein